MWRRLPVLRVLPGALFPQVTTSRSPLGGCPLVGGKRSTWRSARGEGLGIPSHHFGCHFGLGLTVDTCTYVRLRGFFVPVYLAVPCSVLVLPEVFWIMVFSGR